MTVKQIYLSQKLWFERPSSHDSPKMSRSSLLNQEFSTELPGKPGTSKFSKPGTETKTRKLEMCQNETGSKFPFRYIPGFQEYFRFVCSLEFIEKKLVMRL